MGMQNPTVSEPFDKFSEIIGEGVPFYLESVRTVTAKSKDYGEGEMVVIRVRGNERELGIWGSYLLAQARSIEASDLGQWYVVRREVVPGFGKPGNMVKAFRPVPAPAGGITSAG